MLAWLQESGAVRVGMMLLTVIASLPQVVCCCGLSHGLGSMFSNATCRKGDGLAAACGVSADRPAGKRCDCCIKSRADGHCETAHPSKGFASHIINVSSAPSIAIARTCESRRHAADLPEVGGKSCRYHVEMWSAVATPRSTVDLGVLDGRVSSQAALLSTWPLYVAIDHHGRQSSSWAADESRTDSGNARQRCALWQSWQI
jgi:hypothetical protein